MKDLREFEITVWQRENNRKYIYDYSAKITKGVVEARVYEGGGISIYRNRAKRKAVYEAVERYCGSCVPPNLLKKPYQELKGGAINPHKLILFDENQYQPTFLYVPFEESKPIEWVQGFSLTTNKETFIPAFAVYLGYNEGKAKGERLFPSLSCGLAIERNCKRAILKGIFELIERENAMLTWMGSFTPPRLDLSQIRSKNLRYLVQKIEEEKLYPVVCITTRDAGVPSVIGIVFAATQTQPYASFGLAADTDIEKAALKSLEEALMVRDTLELLQESNQLRVPGGYAKVKTFLDHATFYALPEKRKLWEFLLEGENINSKEAKVRFGFQNVSAYTLDCMVSMMKNLKIEVIAVDLTDALAESMGLRVTKVIMPGIHQMDFDYNARFLGGDRVKNIIQGDQKTKKLNHSPHPFA